MADSYNLMAEVLPTIDPVLSETKVTALKYGEEPAMDARVRKCLADHLTTKHPGSHVFDGLDPWREAGHDASPTAGTVLATPELQKGPLDNASFGHLYDRSRTAASSSDCCRIGTRTRSLSSSRFRTGRVRYQCVRLSIAIMYLRCEFALPTACISVFSGL